MTKIGDLIKEFRVKAGITTKDLAGRVGCSRQYLSLVESNVRIPSTALVNRVAKSLNLDLEDARLLGVEVDVNNFQEVETQSSETKDDKVVASSPANLPGKGYMVKFPQNTPTLYTDFIYLSWNQYGVVISAGQRLAATNEVNIVSSMGMSRDHAESLYTLLGKELSKMKK